MPENTCCSAVAALLLFLTLSSLLLLFDIVCSQSEAVEKQLLRYGNLQVSFLIFFLYYGVPIVTVEMGRRLAASDDGVVVPEFETAGRFLRSFLFPLSTIGMGVRMSRWGMSHTEADASIGGLVVFWAGQVTAGKLMDAMDALYLHN
jgi:hypothetical protein